MCRLVFLEWRLDDELFNCCRDLIVGFVVVCCVDVGCGLGVGVDDGLGLDDVRVG